MKVACIITLYNPCSTNVQKLIEVIEPQVDFIYLGDNSEEKKEKFSFSKLSHKRKYCHFGGNYGIAYAQNRGIKYIQNSQNEIEYLLFLDQDSLPDGNLVSKLLRGFISMEGLGFKIGGIGAFAINADNLKPYKRKEFVKSRINSSIKEVSEIMSSASLISLNVFNEIGYFEEELFIDAVDYELCWRASFSSGYKFFISEDICFFHVLGEGDRKLFKKNISTPSPFRVYYQFRNYLFLIRRDYVPLKWKIKNGSKYLFKFLYFSIFLNPRKKYFYNMIRGIKDGLFLKSKKIL